MVIGPPFFLATSIYKHSERNQIQKYSKTETWQNQFVIFIQTWQNQLFVHFIRDFFRARL